MSNEGDVQVLVPSSDPGKGMGIAITKLTLDQEPLSKAITPIMENINFDALDKTILHYHKNRVYVAVCLNGATEPNSLLVYNSLYSTWESMDLLPISIKDIVSFRGKMYIASADAVYEYEQTQTGGGTPIAGKIITRDYLLGSRDIKKFVRGTIDTQVKSIQSCK